MRGPRLRYLLFVLRGVGLATGHTAPLRAHGDALLDTSVNPETVIAVEERTVGFAAVRAGRFLYVLCGAGSWLDQVDKGCGF